MKKWWVLVLAGAMVLLAAACQRTDVRGTETGPEKTDETATAEKTTEPETGKQMEPETGKGAAPSSEADLAGAWELLPRGGIARGPLPGAMLEFDPETGAFTFTKDQQVLTGTYGTGKIREFSRTEDRVVLTPKEATFGFGSGNAVDVPVTFEFFRGEMDGKKVLLLRELDQPEELRAGLSATYSDLGAEYFTYPDCAYDSFWVFECATEEGGYLTDEENDALLVKGQEFYAMHWLQTGDQAFLQPLAAKEIQQESGNRLVYTYVTTDRQRDRAALYRLDERLLESPLPDGLTYQPRVVRVRTDAKGAVVELEELQRAEDNAYFPYMNGTGSEWRDPAVYGEADAAFLGTWKLTAGSVTLTIRAASLQVGGYELELQATNGLSGKGCANLNGAELQINQTEFPGGMTLTGHFTKTDPGIRFTVEGSTIPGIDPGATYDFTK